jgi:hypothetical protein
MDPIFEMFLRRQHEEAGALNEASDVTRLGALDAQRFVLELDAPCLVREGTEVSLARGCVAMIFFSSSYLRERRPREVVAVIRPQHLWHPNAAPPHVCLGALRPGASLIDLTFQLYEVITFQRYSLKDPLSREATEWMRDSSEAWSRETGVTFPLTRAPLKRRHLSLAVNTVAPPPKPEVR